MKQLPNAETGWARNSKLSNFDTTEVVQRIGPTGEPVELLSGGLANSNIRIGKDRVLRIYRRDPEAIRKEHSLLLQRWCHLRVPRVIGQGLDHLLLEYVAHGPLGDAAESGAEIGRALGEIHAVKYGRSGLLGPELELMSSLDPFPVRLAEHAEGELESAPAEFREHLAGILQKLREHQDALLELCKNPVLLHGDFKASNLLRASSGELLVLDWEFAYAGPALMDVGQLLRWLPSDAFQQGFAQAYRNAGGDLPQHWRAWASIFDLGNLAGLLSRSIPGSQRAHDVIARISRTLTTPEP